MGSKKTDHKAIEWALGAFAGLVGLIAMVRLVFATFAGSPFAWVFVLLAMVPWVIYVAWRAAHGRLRSRRALLVLILSLCGLIAVWFFTAGPVLALACSLAGFGVIWVSDWPPRRMRDESRFVRIEELTAEESELG